MAVNITPEAALSIYQLAMLVKKDWMMRTNAAAGDGWQPTDAEVIKGLSNDVARVTGRSAEWYKENPETPPAL